MLCDQCHKREATVVGHRFVPGKTELVVGSSLCDSCAASHYGTPLAAHRFHRYFTADEDRVLRVTLSHGDVLRLRAFSVVNPTIDGIADEWTATVVEPVAGTHPDFARLFHAGSGVDIVESDITEIVDDASGTVLFSAK
jgi:hypothetical protein